MATHSFIKRTLILLLSSLLSTAAQAHWFVYELKFTPEEEDSVNFGFYTGAYMLAPVRGGPASLIFTSEDAEGRFFAVSGESARFFTTANASSRRLVISALAMRGSSQAFYTASGTVNQTLTIPTDKGYVSYRTASKITGRLLAADDDSEALTLPADGSLGMIGSALISGSLRSDLTLNACRFASQEDATLDLIGLLEHYGYQPETAPAPQPQLIEAGPIPSLILDPVSANPPPLTSPSSALLPDISTPNPPLPNP
jgi:hypothetical protein